MLFILKNILIQQIPIKNDFALKNLSFSKNNIHND